MEDVGSFFVALPAYVSLPDPVRSNNRLRYQHHHYELIPSNRQINVTPGMLVDNNNKNVNYNTCLLTIQTKLRVSGIITALPHDYKNEILL